jgi:hypothetical protein
VLDGIIDGFKNGLKSASDFADSFEDMMRSAVLNSLKYQTLEKPLQDWYQAFADKAGDADGLTQFDINSLQNMYNQILQQASSQFDNLQSITGIALASGSSSVNSLKGAIKGMTEQQAELLAGQFGGLRMTAIDILKMSESNLKALNEIVYNTSYLPLSYAILKEFKTKGVKVY